MSIRRKYTLYKRYNLFALEKINTTLIIDFYKFIYSISKS